MPNVVERTMGDSMPASLDPEPARPPDQRKGAGGNERVEKSGKGQGVRSALRRVI